MLLSGSSGSINRANRGLVNLSCIAVAVVVTVTSKQASERLQEMVAQEVTMGKTCVCDGMDLQVVGKACSSLRPVGGTDTAVHALAAGWRSKHRLPGKRTRSAEGEPIASAASCRIERNNAERSAKPTIGWTRASEVWV